MSTNQHVIDKFKFGQTRNFCPLFTVVISKSLLSNARLPVIAIKKTLKAT
jgi:hypothetical protein